MCLIVYSKSGKAAPEAWLSHAFQQNGDGIGIMSREGVEKFLGKKMFKRAKRRIAALVATETPYAIHFRWRTHGAITLQNTHPYKAKEGNHFIMHNGILSGDCTAESSEAESDTAVYVRKYMSEGVPDFDDEQYWRSMGTHIGWGNKFCVMDTDGNFQLVNAAAGFWKDDIWYSNTYSLPANASPSRGYYLGGGWDAYDDEVGGGTGVSRFSSRSEVYSTAFNTYAGFDSYKEAVANGFKWDYLNKVWVDEELAEERRAVVLVPIGNKDYPNKELTWDSRDRRSYYEELERTMTDAQAAEYNDTGHVTAFEPGELAALRAMQERVLAAAYVADKPDSPIGGDFAQGYEDDIAEESEPEEEEQNRFKRYIKNIAAQLVR